MKKTKYRYAVVLPYMSEEMAIAGERIINNSTLLITHVCKNVECEHVKEG